MRSTLNNVLEQVNKLPFEQQETLVEVVRHRLVEERRKQIASNAEKTLKAFRSGKAKKGTVDDLRKVVRSFLRAGK